MKSSNQAMEREERLKDKLRIMKEETLALISGR
jgi:hypothetical protein